MKKPIGVLPLALLLVACTTTMTRSECQGGHWSEAGYSDAILGLTPNRFKAHAKACEKHQISAKKPLYDQGYNKGLKVYCQPENGLGIGGNADDYKGICPAAAEPSFLRAYIQGLHIALYKLESRYSRARDDLSEARYDRILHEPENDLTKRIDREIQRQRDLMNKIYQKRARINATINLWLRHTR